MPVQQSMTDIPHHRPSAPNFSQIALLSCLKVHYRIASNVYAHSTCYLVVFTACVMPSVDIIRRESHAATQDVFQPLLTQYNKDNHLRPNPAKTQLTAFNLNNRHADRKLNVTWNCTKLDHTNSPVYLGITLDRSLTYRNHCTKTRSKLSSRNNLLRKLHGTNWGACPHTMRTTATALCLSVAEYCCPVWARSTHRKLVDITLNETRRLITECIRPTATPYLYVLSGIAPPEIRRSVHSQNERSKQLTGQRHSLHHHQPVKSRLHSQNSFISTYQHLMCSLSPQKPVSRSGKNSGSKQTAI